MRLSWFKDLEKIKEIKDYLSNATNEHLLKLNFNNSNSQIIFKSFFEFCEKTLTKISFLDLVVEHIFKYPFYDLIYTITGYMKDPINLKYYIPEFINYHFHGDSGRIGKTFEEIVEVMFNEYYSNNINELRILYNIEDIIYSALNSSKNKHGEYKFNGTGDASVTIIYTDKTMDVINLEYKTIKNYNSANKIISKTQTDEIFNTVVFVEYFNSDNYIDFIFVGPIAYFILYDKNNIVPKIFSTGKGLKLKDSWAIIWYDTYNNILLKGKNALRWFKNK